MSRVLYPGSFDPITKGHMNIIEQASELFDEVLVAVLQNSSKKDSLFTIQERLKMLSELYKDCKNIKIVTGSVAVDIALLFECQAIVRGIRSSKDYEDEVGIQQVNRDLSDNKINTVILFANRNYQFISSTVVKEVLKLNKDISNYVDPYVKQKIMCKKRGRYERN